MKTFAETSFLCALYRPQDNSPRADAHLARHRSPLVVSSLVLWELRQAARFQVFRFERDRTQGHSKAEFTRMMADVENNLKINFLRLESSDWSDVLQRAEIISSARTPSGGHRSMDILHVATALHLGATHFLTFDENQKKLALVEGLKVPL